MATRATPPVLRDTFRFIHVGLKPNSITLAGSKLVADQLQTTFEPDSVMEFGF